MGGMQAYRRRAAATEAARRLSQQAFDFGEAS